MTGYVIEKNVPLPANYARKYPFGDMDVGDSFPIDNRNKVTSAASYYGKRNGKKFSVRKDSNGSLRVWRVL